MIFLWFLQTGNQASNIESVSANLQLGLNEVSMGMPQICFFMKFPEISLYASTNLFLMHDKKAHNLINLLWWIKFVSGLKTFLVRIAFTNSLCMLLAVNSPLENIHFHQLCMSKKMIHPQDLQNCNFLQLNWYQTTKKRIC